MLGIKIASADFCSENSKKEEKEEMEEAFSEKGGQGGAFTSQIMMVDKIKVLLIVLQFENVLIKLFALSAKKLSETTRS